MPNAEVFKRPSFFAFILNGLLFFIALVYLFLYYKELKPRDYITILLLASIAIGIHGILHHIEEMYYGLNPLRSS